MRRTIVTLLAAMCLALPVMAQDSKPAEKAVDDKNEKLISQYQQEIQDLHSIIKQYDAQIKQLKEQITLLNKQLATLTQKLEGPAQGNTAPAPANATPANNSGNTQPQQSYWVNLLDKVNVKDGANSGQWQLNANGLAGSSSQGGMGMIVLPVTPTGNYDMTFEFCRTNGSNEVQLDIPVGPKSIRIVLSRPNGWTDDNQFQKFAAGIEYVNGMGVLQNQMFSGNNFIMTNGQNHYLHIRVRTDGKKAAVDVFYDDTELADWSGELSEISMFPDPNAKQARRFGLAISAGTMIQVYEARVRMFNTSAAPAAPATAPAPAPAAGGN